MQMKVVELQEIRNRSIASTEPVKSRFYGLA